MAKITNLDRERTTYYEGNRVSVREVQENTWDVSITGRIGHTEQIKASSLFEANDLAFKILYSQQKM